MTQVSSIMFDVEDIVQSTQTRSPRIAPRYCRSRWNGRFVPPITHRPLFVPPHRTAFIIPVWPDGLSCGIGRINQTALRSHLSFRFSQTSTPQSQPAPHTVHSIVLTQPLVVHNRDSLARKPASDLGNDCGNTHTSARLVQPRVHGPNHFHLKSPASEQASKGA